MQVNLTNRELAALSAVVDKFRVYKRDRAAAVIAGGHGLCEGTVRKALEKAEALERDIKDPRTRIDEDDLEGVPAEEAGRTIEAVYEERDNDYYRYIGKVCGVEAGTAMLAAEDIGRDKKEWEFYIRDIAKEGGRSVEEETLRFLKGTAERTLTPLPDVGLIYRAVRETPWGYLPVSAEELLGFLKAVSEAPDQFPYISAEEAARAAAYGAEDLSAGLSVIYRRESKRRTMLQVMKDYHSGDPARAQNAVKNMYFEMEGFIWDQVKAKAPTWKGTEHMADIVSECKAEMFKDMERYDPNQSLPTSYFAKTIQHAITGTTSGFIYKGTTAHYAKLAKKVQTGIAELEKKELPVNINTVSIVTDLPLQQVQSGMDILKGCNEKHYENPAEIDADYSGRVKSTEQLALDNERSRVIQNAIARLVSPGDKDGKRKIDIFFSHISGASFTEISKTYGCSTHVAEVICTRMKTRLRRDPELYAIYHNTDTAERRKPKHQSDGSFESGVRHYRIGDIEDLYEGFD